MKIRRGDILYADLGGQYQGSMQGGMRPVVVVSNNMANKHSSVITVVPLSTKIFKKKNLLTHVFVSAYRAEGLKQHSMEDLNYDTIRGYRNSHRSLKEGHPFERLSDHEYLRSIGAAAISDEDGQLHPTAAGMLMFGDEYNIVRHFPEYFLDYREGLDPTTRWSDRLQSSSGEWSGNVCDFYFRVHNKIIKDVKVPFKMSGGERVDDTPVHKTIREALANCLINADYHACVVL